VSLAVAYDFHELGFERFHLGAHLIGAAERHPSDISVSDLSRVGVEFQNFMYGELKLDMILMRGSELA
jgi:hypothetical protein